MPPGLPGLLLDGEPGLPGLPPELLEGLPEEDEGEPGEPGCEGLPLLEPDEGEPEGLEELELELGLLGGCGIVGLLALGQPTSSAQLQARAPPRAQLTSGLFCLPLSAVISPGHMLGGNRLAGLESRSELGPSELPH